MLTHFLLIITSEEDSMNILISQARKVAFEPSLSHLSDFKACSLGQKFQNIFS
jgi:hypothetical protein